LHVRYSCDGECVMSIVNESFCGFGNLTLLMRWRMRHVNRQWVILWVWQPPSVAGFQGGNTPLPSKGGLTIKYNNILFLFSLHMCVLFVGVV